MRLHRRSVPRGGRSGRTCQLVLEALEPRWVPSGLTVPAYSSLPSASASVYLDFNGHYEPSWGSYGAITSPAYSTDSEVTSFSSTELSNIQKIWQYVAEDFAPFPINVTTVEPPSFANGVALRVVIGGNSSWTGGTYGGIAYVGSFTNSASNTVYVFPAHLGNGHPKYVADAASHEAGHAFGLRHQSSYSGTTRTADYQSGPGDGTAPLLGNSYSATRSLWWYGATTSSTTFQDDMAVLASATNGFGYRADDHGDRFNSTPLMVAADGSINSAGVIEKMTDTDWFSFTTAAGTITLTADVAEPFNNLDATLELYDSAGTRIAFASPSNSFDATLTLSVSAGTYYAVVSSAGVSANATATNYGFNVGQYRLIGTVIPTSSPGVAPAAPSNLSATAQSSSSIRLTWTDNAGNETGFQIERLVNGSWTQVATVGANVTSWDDTGLTSATSYSYRVRASNSYGTSTYTNTASATTSSSGSVPAAASNLIASQQTRPWLRNNLTWRDNSANETGFYIERSTDGGATWVRYAQVSANVTSYQDRNISRGITYYYRVLAFNSFGTASPSNVAQIGGTTSGGGGKGKAGSLGLLAHQLESPSAASPTPTLGVARHDHSHAHHDEKRLPSLPPRPSASEGALNNTLSRGRTPLKWNRLFGLEVELNTNVVL